MTAYQIACEALVALGHAEPREWGAIPSEDPALPAKLPRWDDVFIAVLGLAEQNGQISYRAVDGSLPSPATTIFQGGKAIEILPVPQTRPPDSNILPLYGLGPAFAEPNVHSILEEFGVLESGEWSERAETLFWRVQPKEWAMNVTSNARFLEAIKEAVATLPDHIRAEMTRLVTITDEDVAAAMAKTAAAIEKHRAEYGPKAQISGANTPESARSSLEFACRGDLDWLFFRSWRLDGGWLAPNAAEVALGIFHDPLAISMRRAVIGRLYPDLPFAAL